MLSTIKDGLNRMLLQVWNAKNSISSTQVMQREKNE